MVEKLLKTLLEQEILQLYSNEKICFYKEKLLWKLRRSRLGSSEQMIFETFDDVVKQHLLKYTHIPPVIVLWGGENLWTFISGQEVVSFYDGSIYRICLDDINKKIKAPSSVSSKDGSKFDFNYIFLGDSGVKIWAPEGNVIFAIMNILQMFPLKKNDIS
ncbi:hypothetical protein CBX33_21895 [Salmonella enterica]|nr:hypothetical protein [Salmonella enterica]EKT7570162.1 hypothetical protein [Salmonella enterica]EKT7778759.1 hypothetical protein [Salmonella enterica]VEA63299.1 Uncharacterised protein [Salmonella enterica subsp. salamae]HAO4184559.1 hypothetical protein [Salmonella enterica]